MLPDSAIFRVATMAQTTRIGKITFIFNHLKKELCFSSETELAASTPLTYGSSLVFTKRLKRQKLFETKGSIKYL